MDQIRAAARLSVAPMMDWTDRHCRFLHRLLSRRALLYTEMITAAALVHGDAARLLRFHPGEHPVALQIGGSEPDLLHRATEIARDFGYDEINLNVGCPSDRVQSGAFGAVLMKDPALVRRAMEAIADAAGCMRVSVKCRIGVDDQDPSIVLPEFLAEIQEGGVRDVIIHARMAWLQGLSPKENRDIPPLNYDLVRRMKREFPGLHLSINGGITDLDAAVGFLDAGIAGGLDGGLARGLDGVMIGRAAYHDPARTLLDVDRRIFGAENPRESAEDAVRAMLPYIAAECAAGTRLAAITRHMLGLFNGRPGARHWRRTLSEGAHKPGADHRLVETALGHIGQRAA